MRRFHCDREKIILVTSRLKILSIALAALISIVAAAPALAASSEAEARAGAVLFRDKGCAHCHGVGGIGGKKAPSLVDIRKNKLWPPDKITGQIVNGGQKMPPFGDALSDQEIAQLVAYLRAKHRPVPPPAANNAPPPAPGP
jgi:mono/diheme cytochrome c family protein